MLQKSQQQDIQIPAHNRVDNMRNFSRYSV
jgi:hypothetical protein